MILRFKYYYLNLAPFSLCKQVSTELECSLGFALFLISSYIQFYHRVSLNFIACINGNGGTIHK